MKKEKGILILYVCSDKEAEDMLAELSNEEEFKDIRGVFVSLIDIV